VTRRAIVVIVIAAVIVVGGAGVTLLALVGARAGERLEIARAHAARQAMKNLRAAIANYRADHVECPRDLHALVEARYLTRDALDPWGEPYVMICPATHAELDAADLLSKGPDRVQGTADDLHSWDAP